jgi:uncharacterized damage-inducible protein DinB
MQREQDPKLAAPGAGLPLLESVFLRYFYYPFRAKRFSWSDNLKRLHNETLKIVSIIQNLPEEQFQTRVLIPRLKGMEDSSRFWSVALTVEHLCITIKGMTFIASELAQGNDPHVTVGTAAVKPKQENVLKKEEMIKKLQTATAETITLLSKFTDSHSEKNKSYHPWFGEIDAAGWVWVLGQHQSLHRKQIHQIYKSFS